MVRYFAYIDVPTIESFYNQLDKSYMSKKINTSKGREIDGEIKISLPNVIRGFFNGEGALKATNKKLTTEEIQLINSIENKIETLLKIADNNENNKVDIDSFSTDRSLICGKIKVVEKNKFLDITSKLYNKNFNDLDVFLRKFYKDKDMIYKWSELEKLLDGCNGLSVLRIMDCIYVQDESLFTFIVIDNDEPITMDLSYKKITIPESDLRSSGLFASTTEFNILGITNKIGKYCMLKPLALWKIMNKHE